jgi:hypothetical protein
MECLDQPEKMVSTETQVRMESMDHKVSWDQRDLKENQVWQVASECQDSQEIKDKWD